MSVRKKILVVYQEGTESNMGLKECTSIKNWLAVIILISVAWKMRKKEKMWSLHSERQIAHEKDIDSHSRRMCANK